MLTRRLCPRPKRLLGGGNYSDIAVGLHNNRGQLLNPPWTPNAISSSYQTFTVPSARWCRVGSLTSAGPITVSVPQVERPSASTSVQPA